MGRRSRKRQRAREPVPTTDYLNSDGDVLTLRDELSEGTVRGLERLDARPAASADDRWQRRAEYLFERLTVSWTIAGLPLTGQKELLARYRMADSATRRWVRETIEAHLDSKSG